MLNIPLARTMFADKHFQIRTRALDAEWFYQKIVPGPAGGFDPTIGCAYVAQYSATSEWLRSGKSSPRKFNFEDRLMTEVLFAIHDYLHNWSYRLINSLKPKLRLGVGSITKKNFESMVFCHILTEAVATVGLDYWYLSTVELDDVVAIGTNRTNLTVAYHEKNRSEYVRFHSDIDVQNPKFLATLTKFYCDGEFPGFELADLMRSPKLFSWLQHELRYGEDQRKYTRSWLNHLAGRESPLSDELLVKTISCSERWQKELVRDVAAALWDLVKYGKSLDLKPVQSFGPVWQSKPSRKFISDGRFVNLNSFGFGFWDAVLQSKLSIDDKRWVFRQLVSKYKLSKIAPEDVELIKAQASEPNFEILKHILRNYKPIRTQSEKADIFLIN